MADITFNAERHEYTHRGVLVPSVTQILQAEGFTAYYGNASAAAERGTWVHKAAALIDNGMADVNTPEDPGWVPYLFAYESFLADHPPLAQWVEIEQPHYNSTWHIAGTPDRVTTEYIVDIKTGKPTPADQLQLAGYGILMDKTDLHRMNLYLQSDGEYKVVYREDKKDYVIFQNAVCSYYWKLKHGVTK